MPQLAVTIGIDEENKQPKGLKLEVSMKFFNSIRMPLFNADPGAFEGGNPNGVGDQQPAKTFTQAEVDAMMASRWKDTELTKTELKEMTDLIKGFGYEGATPAEIKAQLKVELDARNKQQELKALENEAAISGASPELLAKIDALQKKIDKLDEKEQKQQEEMEQKQEAENAWNAQVQEFQTKHADVDMEKLAKNEKFMKFLGKSNPSIPFVDVYETYIELVGDAEAAAIDKIKSNADRSTFSGKSKADPSGGTHGLNDHQQSLAKQNDMTYKEYAELLKDIN